MPEKRVQLKKHAYRDRVGRIIRKGDLVLVSTVVGLNGEFRVRKAANKELAIGKTLLRDVYPSTLRLIER